LREDFVVTEIAESWGDCGVMVASGEACRRSWCDCVGDDFDDDITRGGRESGGGGGRDGMTLMLLLLMLLPPALPWLWVLLEVELKWNWKLEYMVSTRMGRGLSGPSSMTRSKVVRRLCFFWQG
jgi:hypothetical protein